MKWYTKLFNKLLHSSIHNPFVIHRESLNMKKKLDHPVFRVKAMEAYRIGLQFPHLGKPPKTSTTERLTTRHFVERKPPAHKQEYPVKK